jgi:hypothetical protein
MKKKLQERKEEIISLINENRPKAYICKILKCRPSTLETFLKKNNIIYKGNQTNKGYKINIYKRSIYDYLKNDGPSIQSHILRLRLIKENIKKKKCENCNLENWLGNEIPLELHHIDGNRFNNELNNLQILCPNCHSLTPNNSGKSNKGRKTKIILEISKEELEKKENIKKKNIHDRRFKRRTVERPPYEELKKEVWSHGFLATGRKYGVSDNAIRKWIKYYEIYELNM